MKLTFLFITLLFSLSLFAEEMKPYKVFIRPGTVVKKLSDNKEYKLEKGIFANVLETSPTRRDLFLIYDKNGKATYSTTAWGIVEIAKDLQILPDVDAQLIYPEPSVFKKNNAHAYFDTQFNLHLDSLQTQNFNKVNGQDFAANTMGNRFELRTLYNSTLPVNFGFSANYEIAKWSNELEQLDLNIFSVGPHLQHYIFQEDNIALSVLFGAEYAPIYTTSSALGTDKYTATIFDIGAEGMWDSNFGKWSLGLHYRRHDLSLSSTTREGAALVPESISLNSIGGMLGFKYEWNL